MSKTLFYNKDSIETTVNAVYITKLQKTLENLLTVNFIYTLYLQKKEVYR